MRRLDIVGERFGRWTVISLYDTKNSSTRWQCKCDCPDGLTLERKDNNGNYCKENCIWETRQHQSRNRRSTKLNENAVSNIRASLLTQQELADLYGVSQTTIWQVQHGYTWK